MIQDQTSSPDDYRVPDVENRWQDFLVGVLAHTVELCIWLSAQSAGRCQKAYPRTLHRRLLNAATAWRWVFATPDCELPLEEVCLFLGLSVECVRSRILAACAPPPDINQVVANILLECGDCDGKPKRKTAAARRVVALDWARLRDFRSHHPTGTGIEDFRRLEMGGFQDPDDGGRGGSRAPGGRAPEPGGISPLQLPGAPAGRRRVRGSR